MLDVGTGGQSSSTEWLREEQQQLCLWVAAPIRNSQSEIPDQKFPISFIPASSWKGGLPNLGRSPRGKLPGKGFLHGSSLKGVGTVDPRRREKREGGRWGLLGLFSSCAAELTGAGVGPWVWVGGV